MKIDNPLDELLFAATMGLAPDDEDLDAVVVPPGQDAARFRGEVVKTAEDIMANWRDGAPGEGRRIAEETAGAYLAMFPTPQPANRQSDDDALRNLLDNVPRDGVIDFDRQMTRISEEQD